MSSTHTSISIPAGSEVNITVLSDVYSGQGFFPIEKDKLVRLNNKEVAHTLGFVSENESSGVIEANNEGDTVTVKYKHLQNEENRIHFFAANGDHSIISVVSIPIHDHSSVYQGGPAFGTYYYDETEDSASNKVGDTSPQP